MAGPGHKPIRPQPIPKIEAPKINFESILVNVGRENVSHNIGFCLFLLKKNIGVVTNKAPPMTKISEGSHAPKIFKKPNTFSGLIMPDTVKPNPKIIPAIPEANLVFMKQDLSQKQLELQ